MPKEAPKSTDTSSSAKRPGLGEWLPAIIFVLILIAGFSVLIWRQVSSKAQHVQAIQQNEKLGLPADYPLDVVPLYQGMKLDKCERSETKSSENEPMDSWHLTGTSSDEPKKIYEFYNGLMQAANFSQNMYISIPGGYGVEFADEQQVINYQIEKDHKDPQVTNIDITFSRLKK